MNIRTPKYAVFFAFAVSLSVLPLRAQDVSGNAKSHILALEHAWNQAEAFKDFKALETLFDNGLIYVDADGRLLTKAEFLAEARQSHIQQVVTESMTVQMYASTAIVTGTYHAIELQHGKAVVLRGRFVDTWVFKDATWVCVAAQATPLLR